jgi:methyl-accepting chemotaxis protein
MRKTLKLKIFASFMLLVMLLAAAGTISILEFRWLSDSFHGMIQDNYKSIEASKTMVEALEREDSGILLIMLGQWNQGHNILYLADSSFNAELEIVKQNITEPDEDKYIADIEIKYAAYKKKWTVSMIESKDEETIDWYKNEMHQSFLITKKVVNDLMSLNQTSMYNEAYAIKERAHRAIMPGIVTIIGALVFSILLNFFIVHYFVRPLEKLTLAVKKYRTHDTSLQVNIKSNDEIKALEQAINNLLVRLEKEKDLLQ